MKLSVLGSGSAGNCVIFGTDKTGYWLVDAGLSAKQISLRLEALGIALDQIKGILISHEHKDHIGGLPVFLKKCQVKVYASVLTHEYLTSQLKMKADWAVFEPGQTFSLGTYEVEAVRIPHDATDPVGYLVNGGETKLAVMTDLGYVSESLANRLKGVDLMYLESNYDEQLLEEDQKRPWSIKQRISSRHGHLSNTQAAELIKTLRLEGLQKVALGHLSQDCNTPDCIMKLMEELPSELEVAISSQKEPTQWLEILPPEPVVPAKPVRWKQQTLF